MFPGFSDFKNSCIKKGEGGEFEDASEEKEATGGSRRERDNEEQDGAEAVQDYVAKQEELPFALVFYLFQRQSAN